MAEVAAEASSSKSSGHAHTESEQLAADYEKIRIASSAFAGGSASIEHVEDEKDAMNHNKWQIPGLATLAYGHQVVGAGTMISLESEKDSKVKGGILADEMGLGSQ